MEKLQAKYGNDPSNWVGEDEDSSSYSSEDSNADLNTDKVEAKFNDLMDKIKNKDETLFEQMCDSDANSDYFNDSDFEQNESTKKNKKDKKVTYKDVLRNDVLKKIDRDDSSESEDEPINGKDIFKKAKGETIAEE